MIARHAFGPYFSPPDGGPFLTEARILLNMAGLPCDEDRNDLFKAPMASCRESAARGEPNSRAARLPA
ncbi:hypothetical protein CCR94_18050 [Rhodoblastus sphagnicola]|uniref:Uncharacterized protein n=1 Tax=Rhodoblastus sphagnicola TaxID=333368 RepID=A0A2S6N1A9_9HYPH|nr:hypothetical protein [Rhodoblastus sphagnicola]MBB4200385.1 hypothetical protein [Rhodoblastus sphagnicola]PPQ28378.1 hypothetical protein CCR94_18050 [Rhodoblastus sphagnicola]